MSPSTCSAQTALGRVFMAIREGVCGATVKRSGSLSRGSELCAKLCGNPLSKDPSRASQGPQWINFRHFSKDFMIVSPECRIWSKELRALRSSLKRPQILLSKHEIGNGRHKTTRGVRNFFKNCRICCASAEPSSTCVRASCRSRWASPIHNSKFSSASKRSNPACMPIGFHSHSYLLPLGGEVTIKLFCSLTVL